MGVVGSVPNYSDIGTSLSWTDIGNFKGRPDKVSFDGTVTSAGGALIFDVLTEINHPVVLGKFVNRSGHDMFLKWNTESDPAVTVRGGDSLDLADSLALVFIIRTDSRKPAGFTLYAK